MQADVDHAARRFRLVAKIAHEHEPHGLLRLQRRLKIGHARDKLDRLADDVLRHAVAKPRAVDPVRDAVAHRDFRLLRRVVHEPCGDDGFRAVAIVATLAERDGPDILAALEDRDLHDPVVAAGVQCADRKRDAARRKGLDMQLRGRRALDRPRALLGEAVGDQEVTDLLRHDRFQDRVENLRFALSSAGADLQSVAVGAGQELGLSVQGRVGAAVVVRSGVGLRLILGALRLLGVHLELGGQRVGLLSRLRKPPHVAAGGRRQGRVHEIGLLDRIAGRPGLTASGVSLTGTAISRSFGAATAPRWTSTGSPGRSMIEEILVWGAAFGAAAVSFIAAVVGPGAAARRSATRQTMSSAQRHATASDTPNAIYPARRFNDQTCPLNPRLAPPARRRGARSLHQVRLDTPVFGAEGIGDPRLGLAEAFGD